MRIAALLTCFNRKNKTQKCLEILFEQTLPPGSELQVFVCDDGSTDGTHEMINSKFPQVQVISGDGNLFWGGGMRAAWKKAIESENFDFYLWLNDDTFIFKDSLIQIFKDYRQIGTACVISAACKLPGTEGFSYGGHNELSPIIPNGQPQSVKYINGNLVLIPRVVVEKIGVISKLYTHYLGDFDYGLRAQSAGFPCYTTSTYLAECGVNDIPYWGNPDLSLSLRWKMAHDFKGLALSEYIAFKSYHHGKWVGFKTWIDSYLKILFPAKYTRLRDRLFNRSRL